MANDRMIDIGLEKYILEILTLIDSQSIANARLTCQKWRKVIDKQLW
jgi:hypothetical protein